MSDQVDKKKEILRWILSIGIFYVLYPAMWLLTGFLYEKVISLDVIDGLGQAQYPLGIILFLFGAFLSYSSFRDQLKRGRGHPFGFTGKGELSRPTRKLLTDRVYYWSRNPMNLGDMFIYAGLSVIVNCNGGLVINTPLYYMSVWINSRFFERKGLIDRFGDEYIKYEKNTSVIIPGVRTFRKIVSRSYGQSRFS